MSDERTLDLLEAKIEELRELNATDGIDLSKEIAKLEKKLTELRREFYSNLTDWERVKLARHPKRPYSLDYIGSIFSGFYELHGDRIAGDDRALITGLARLDGKPVAVVAQQKGRSTEENRERFFGMTRPQGYRKARRIMELAERFSFPVVSLIDTPGAYPGLESEELNIGSAIAENLLLMSRLRTPIVAVIIGEGGSGGALAIGLADRVLMLENAIYSVISPEGAAAILWKDKGKVKEAAEALNLTAPRLLELGLIDGVIPEPLGGAHKGFAETAGALKEGLVTSLDELSQLHPDRLIELRYERYRKVGRFREASEEV
ncbi:acetyl-CoA carboxylase carboxyl transferase subunit alpha [Candidatus Acetothermia bacterium]|nr:MAG: acetyl-CoA carboxylase carboxyl transferase subunit alpha [Candidatus Acetothermia bacterium]